MNKKIWFVTRSYPPSRGGGAFVRKQQVDHLRKNGFDVTVIMPPQGNVVKEKNTVIINPIVPLRFCVYLQYLLILRDYMVIWSWRVASNIIENAEKNCILFVTTGGELGLIGSLSRIKERRPDIKIVINYHDLLVSGLYDGESTNVRPHLSVEKLELNGFRVADLVIAQSEIMMEILSKKFSSLDTEVDYAYFGFSNDNELKVFKTRAISDVQTIAYIGNMGKMQKPEVLIEAYRILSPEIRKKIKLLFIGDFAKNSVVLNATDIEKIGFVSREEMANVLIEKVDLAFVSAVNKKTLRPLMPTKFYEYIGLDLPVLCAVPNDCEVERVVNKYKIGLTACHDQINDLVVLLELIANDKAQMTELHENLREAKYKFDSNYTLKKFVFLLNKYIEN